jgi:hypothetical protein
MNPTKSVLHFSDFSVIFYSIYKNLEIPSTIGIHLLQGSPRKVSLLCNVVPRGAAGAAPVKFRRARRQTWPGKDGGGSRGALGFDLMGWTGVEGLQRAALAAPGRMAAAVAVSGEAAANARQPMVAAALGDARGRLGTVGCGGEAGGGGARVSRDGGHGARAGEGIRALYIRLARRLMSCGPKGGASGTQVPGDGGRPAGQADDCTAARRSKRPRHPCDVGKG